jgi:hypothetical protein
VKGMRVTIVSLGGEAGAGEETSARTSRRFTR